jgi:hypothetical protein
VHDRRVARVQVTEKCAKFWKAAHWKIAPNFE